MTTQAPRQGKTAPRPYVMVATPAASKDYARTRLDAEDAARAVRHPAVHDKLEWQVSRVLKARLRQYYGAMPFLHSLSHSRGHAVCAAAPDVRAIGVDLEHMRPRDFAALSAWVCTTEERAALARAGFDAAAFYRLWTVKEALLKAENLYFPEDMVRVGCMFEGDAVKLFSPSGATWSHQSWILDDVWMLSVVWLPENDAVSEKCVLQTPLAACEYGRHG
ncbi:MAG: 4'-phosphopantetheinyl transferase superfamily protein [Neisseria sp.]|nr:4'-phosphopantetheinyl transferase superfamily protein [Neisseria sp.]